MPVCQHVGRATAMGGQNMQSRVKLGSFLRGIALGSTALFAALIVPAKAQDAPGQTVITAARMSDVLTGKTVEFPAIFVGADGRIPNIADARTVRWGSNVKHIDLGDKILLPGLIDMQDRKSTILNTLH